ncbi:unnamed protein product [Medioppia subpectinata]|uniref:Diacylglycerol kinase n=1 Tax=Medioppia subpectinata TaxID=1979941 RepID=A0A7R9KLW8_9ACAR|nr:unnamed protein product [Medioppia subpectinata]CAG2106022.1 unnamed protein product [Medioppia subpectinata]
MNDLTLFSSTSAALESAINADHLWVSTNASGDICYVGENDCSIRFHCKPTFKDVGVRQYREQTVIHHHWVHRRHQKGRCRQCGKSFQSKLSFGNKEIVAISCSWCKTAFHNKENCFNIQRIGENCPLGINQDLIVPPTWIVKLPRRGSFKSSIRRSPKTKRASSKKRTKKDESSAVVTVDNHLHHQLHALHGSSPPPTKEFGAQHRSFAIKPIPSSSSKPLLVFINPKSGGNQGSKLMQKFQWLLNPRQVFDLSQGGPKLGLELYKKVNNLRILACGGDGTAGWVLSVLDEIAIYPPPPLSVLPLGTGNDLARALGWGGSYTDEPVSKILLNIKDGEVVQLDRWNLKVERNNNISPTEQNAIKEDEGAKQELPLNVVNNYFSIGVDAHIALSFHEAREAHPERFNSRLRNKMFYGQAGGKDLLQRKWKDLCNYITLECDDIDLTSRLKEHKVHSVLFLNIPSYGGGTRPWGSSSPCYETPRTDDGLIEVIGLTTYQLPLLQAGGHGTCIAQCRSAKIITTRTIPMQVDGEPCRLLPSIITLELRNQANLIAKAKSHNQTIHVPTLEKLTIKVRKLNLNDYETYHYDKHKLKEVSLLVGTLCIDQNLELVHVRAKINDLMRDKSYSSVQSGADNSCVTTKFVSSHDWCFVDSCTAERFFRIDRAQEDLHFVVDICTDDLYILDPESQTDNDDKEDIDFFEATSESAFITIQPQCNNISNQSSTDESPTTSLHRPLIKDNPIPNVPKDFSQEEVFYAVKQADLSLLKQLHHKGISLLSVDKKGMSALHHASRLGHENIVSFLLSAAPSDLIEYVELESGHTALHMAAKHRQHGICTMLASYGASLSRGDKQGLTAKQLAAKAGDKDLAAFLEHFEIFQKKKDRETAV